MRILNNQEMSQKYEELGNFEHPYFYKVNKGKQQLYCLGSRHSYDPKDPQFKNIESLWNEFLNNSKGTKSVVLVEGGVSRPIENKDEAVIRHAEGGFIINLATKEGVKIESPEPGTDEELKYLADKFSKQEILYYYFARVVAQWHRLTDKRESLEDYLERYMDHYQGQVGWEESDFSYQKQVEFHDQTHDHKFDPDNYNCFYETSHPGKNLVAAASSSFRDEHIFSEIKRLWEEGRSIFVIYGSGHIIKLEPAIKSLV